jgi:1-deoxy-D-xylulose-5-phosphate reductoisomerase
MIKRLAVLGSTGSIGTQALDVVRAFPGRLSVAALAGGHDASLLSSQIAEFKPRFIFAPREISAPGCEILSPEEMAIHPDIDIALIAIPGSAALPALLAAARAGKIIALANKESLVSAGDIIMAAAAKSGAQIRPVDSEHSAIWQCLVGESAAPAHLILTASGGPFLKYSQLELAEVTAAQALRHPSWRMGRKVTIDSATLMNKGFEVLEAHHLFKMPYSRIEVVIHPESIVHSLVEFGDGALKAQLSLPDMRLPIQYALSFPERWDNPVLPRLDLARAGRLDFAAPDYARFPCLKLALEAGLNGGTYPAVLCAADEEAVEMFLSGLIKFTDIAVLVADALSAYAATTNPGIEDILAADRWARETVRQASRRERINC